MAESVKDVATGAGVGAGIGHVVKNHAAKKAAETGAKKVAETGAKTGAKTLGKTLAKAVPGVGLGFAAYDLYKGHKGDALLDAATAIPGVGTVGAFAIGGAQAAGAGKMIDKGLNKVDQAAKPEPLQGSNVATGPLKTNPETIPGHGIMPQTSPETPGQVPVGLIKPEPLQGSNLATGPLKTNPETIPGHGIMPQTSPETPGRVPVGLTNPDPVLANQTGTALGNAGLLLIPGAGAMISSEHLAKAMTKGVDAQNQNGRSLGETNRMMTSDLLATRDNNSKEIQNNVSYGNDKSKSKTAGLEMA